MKRLIIIAIVVGVSAARAAEDTSRGAAPPKVPGNQIIEELPPNMTPDEFFNRQAPNDAAQPRPESEPSSTPTVLPPKRTPSKTVPSAPPQNVPAPKTSSLFAAVYSGDAAEVENHILRGDDLNAKDADGLTPLHHAARIKNLGILNLLLDYGANPNANADPNRLSTPLITASEAGQFEAAACLRAYGAAYTIHHAAGYGDVAAVGEFLDFAPGSIEETTIGKDTPLHTAAANNQLGVVKLLLDKNADTSALNEQGLTPLGAAAMAGHTQTISFFLSRGVRIDQPQSNRDTILHKAIVKGSTVFWDELLRLGVNLNAVNANGMTPLHVATRSEQKSALKWLLSKGALQVPDSAGQTPLHYAAAARKTDIMTILLDAHADVAAKDKDGATPLHAAARAARPAAVDLLIKRGADVNVEDVQLRTPLHASSQLAERKTANDIQRRQQIVSSLLENGADVNARDAEGATPLLIAARAGAVSLVETLLRNGADHSLATHKLGTPLTAGIEAQNLSVVLRLLEHGADPNAKDDLGQTPLHMAVALDNADIVQALLEQQAAPNARTDAGWTPLHTAALKGAARTVQLLLAYAADINATENRARTPLHIASMRDDPGVLTVLIANGADHSLHDNAGQTPLHTAVAAQATPAITALLTCGVDPLQTDNEGRTPLQLARDMAAEGNVILAIRAAAVTAVEDLIRKADITRLKEVPDLPALVHLARIDDLIPLEYATHQNIGDLVTFLESINKRDPSDPSDPTDPFR